MEIPVAVLARTEARQKGYFVIEPGPETNKITLHEESFGLIELQSLAEFDGYSATRFGIVAISKPTGELRVVLEATPCRDDAGTYYAFSSKGVMAEAIQRGLSWVNEHLAEAYGVNPTEHPERFSLSIKKEQRSIAEQFFRWMIEQQGLQICEVQDPSEANAYQRFVPVDVNRDRLIAEFLGIDYEKLMQEHASSLMSAISRANTRKENPEPLPPPFKSSSLVPLEEHVSEEEIDSSEADQAQDSSWLFPIKKKRNRGKNSLLDFLKIGSSS